MKFVELRTTYTLTVLNIGYKIDLIHLKEFVFRRQSFVLHVTKIVKMQVMKFVYGHVTQNSSVVNIGLSINWAKLRFSCIYVWLTVCNMNGIHDTPLVMKELFQGLTCNSSVLNAVYVREFGDLKTLVYEETKFSLLVQYMSTIHDPR